MSADTSLRGRLALDSSVLVEIFNDSPTGRRVVEGLQEPQVEAFTSWVNLTEASYIVCRKVGRERSASARDDLVASGFVTLVEDVKVHGTAAELKCERAISLADCYTLATAAVSGSKPLFLRRENDLARESQKRPFDPEPAFLLPG